MWGKEIRVKKKKKISRFSNTIILSKLPFKRTKLKKRDAYFLKKKKKSFQQNDTKITQPWRYAWKRKSNKRREQNTIIIKHDIKTKEKLE